MLEFLKFGSETIGYHKESPTRILSIYPNLALTCYNGKILVYMNWLTCRHMLSCYEVPMTSNTSRRRYELDWLRVLAILIVFVYHSSRFFNLGDWHVKNINTFVWVEIWNVFATRWMMPLFFIISGASLFYAIAKSGSWSRFYVDKFMRLMIPVLVASVTHSALQVYLERLAHGQFSGSFFSFLPEYFNGVYLGIGMPGNFAFHGMHLWYLLFLFIYSLNSSKI